MAPFPPQALRAAESGRPHDEEERPIEAGFETAQPHELAPDPAD